MRLNSPEQAYLNRVFPSAGNTQTWTISTWIKSSDLNGNYSIFGTGTNGDYTQLLLSGDQISLSQQTASTYTIVWNSVGLYRDPSSWYNIIVTVNTTEGVPTDRIKVFVNGLQILNDGVATYPALNSTTYMNAAAQHNIGAGYATTNFFDGYMADIYFVDGQALSPASFGQTNTASGQWEPISYTGTYGSNGFHLDFKDATPAADLGKEVSGNTNNWTIQNIDAADQVLDNPSNNFCVQNPLAYARMAVFGGGSVALDNGNLELSINDNDGKQHRTMGTYGMSSGKYYWEVTFNSDFDNGGDVYFGLVNDHYYMETVTPSATGAWVWHRNGTIYKDGTSTPSSLTYSSGDVLMFAFDATTKELWLGKNSTWLQGNPATGVGAPVVGITGNFFTPVTDNPSGGSGPGSGAATTTTTIVNFGQGGQPGLTDYPLSGGRYKYPPPCEFKALSTQNSPVTPIIKGADYFSPALYNGNGVAISPSSLNFQPDLVIIKDRSSINAWGWFDGVRGITKYLSSNTNNAETTDATSLTSFNSNGFTLGASATFNTNANDYVSYNWKTDNTLGAANLNGSIPSTVSVNATSNVSVVTYTGTGSNATVGHGLPVQPKAVIIKKRNGISNWTVYHNEMDITPQNGYMQLNSTASYTTDNTYWNNTSPTNSVFSVGTNTEVNASGDNYVAYLFSDVEGFSKMGSYTGNGSTDGPFVWTNFKPAYILIKRVDLGGGGEQWLNYDLQRNTYNPANYSLGSQSGTAEDNTPPGSNSNALGDILSNGFKIRSAGGSNNTQNVKYIFIAFAEVPFKYINSSGECQYTPQHDSVTACDSALINGTWYYTSQTVTDIVPSSFGCDSVVITELTINLANANFTNLSANYCANEDTVTLQPATTGGIFSGNGISGAQFDPSIAGPGNHTISYVITDGNGCKDSTAQSVVIDTIPNAIFSGLSGNYCSNADSVILTPLVTGGTFSGSGLSGTTFYPTVATIGIDTIIYIVIDGNGCSDTSAQSVSVLQVPSTTINITNVLCNGDSTGSASVTVLPGTGLYTFSWNTLPSQTTAIATNLPTGTYICTVTDSSSCLVADTITITEPSVITVVASQTNVNCNGGNTGTASVAVTGGVSPYTYLWDTLSAATSSISNIFAGNYTCVITDSNGCTVTQNIIISQPDNILAQVSSSAGCGNSSAQVTGVTGGTGSYTYSWSPTGGSAATATGLSSGTYTVTITDSSSCSISDSVAVTTLPDPVIAISSDTTINPGSTATLQASGGTSYTWSPAATLSCSGCNNPTASPLVTTLYCVAVSDSNNCTDSACVTVTINDICQTINIPTAFSPNGDGANDLECIYGECLSSVYLVIYDRWGEKIFETNSQQQCWDGTYNGTMLNSAVFVYYLDAILINGTTIKQKGNISLIR